jgi:predicted ferric reductase
MLFHPLMPIASKFLEPGMAPIDALVTLVTTFNRGVLLGIGAWCSMVLLGVTALTRSHLPMGYTTWRIFHGTLAILFIVLAVWHALDLGRHATLSMALYIILLAAGAILPVAMHYLK